MSKPFVIPPQYQQLYSQRFSQEASKVTISMSNELAEWHKHAIKALNFSSLKALRVPSTKYHELFEIPIHGINMNVMMALANNLELRTPDQMGMTAKEWMEVIKLNDAVGNTWNTHAEPIHKRLEREFEIMMNKPKLVVAGEA